VAGEAGYTKGAVYSNFASKEDLFFAVYERRIDRRVEEMEAALRDAPTKLDAIQRMIPGAGDRPAADDGWLAVFFESGRMCCAIRSSRSASHAITVA
jgi:AcrR family transcriptional regulator